MIYGYDLLWWPGKVKDIDQITMVDSLCDLYISWLLTWLLSNKEAASTVFC